MRAIKLNAHVTSDHMLRVRLPEDVQVGPAEVIVLVESNTEATTSPSAGGVAEFLATHSVDPRFVRSKAEIDQALAEEREGWE